MGPEKRGLRIGFARHGLRVSLSRERLARGAPTLRLATVFHEIAAAQHTRG